MSRSSPTSDSSDHRLAGNSCNNAAIRKASRRISRFYDACMAETNLRATQYTILSLLASEEAFTMAALAEILSMDRATMGRNLRPLERDGLIAIDVGDQDRRERRVSLSAVGIALELQGKILWSKAQAKFEEALGKEDASAMRRIMARVVSLEFATSASQR
jgi:DNA-binding MarR family transcriptional regulator